jgi:flagellar protein FlaG
MAKIERSAASGGDRKIPVVCTWKEIMDIKAAKPVSSVSAVKDTAGRQAPVTKPRDAAPSVPPREGQAEVVARELQHRQAVVAEQLRQYLRATDRDLEFRVDGDTGTTVITVRNASTGDVVRQIPNEEALRIMRSLNAESGTFIDLTA